MSRCFCMALALLAGAFCPAVSAATAVAVPPSPPPQSGSTGPAVQIELPRFSVDFVDASLSDVVWYVMQHTGVGFVYATPPDGLTVNWSQMNMTVFEMFHSFGEALAAIGLGCYPVNGSKRLYVIEARRPETKVEDKPKPKRREFRRVSSARVGGRLRLFVGDEVYSPENFPGQLKQVSGEWFARMDEEEKEGVER